MKPVLSVIVPVYKVEPYLRKCVDSIRAQTLQEIEIILVDDGSPDNCGKICDEYAAMDSRIRVVHKENDGLSSARNAGIAIAQADILGFVDSDDWCDADMFALLYRNMLQESADISVCGLTMHAAGNTALTNDPKYAVLSGADAMEFLYQLPIGNPTVWNKLYRKHLFDSIRFPEGKIYEDVFIMPRLMDAADTVVFDMQPKYHYDASRTGSITQNPYRSQKLDVIEAYYENYCFIRDNYPSVEAIAKHSWLSANFTVLFAMFRSPGDGNPSAKKEIIQNLKSNRKFILSYPHFGKKKKLLFLCLCISESLCRFACKILVK